MAQNLSDEYTVIFSCFQSDNVTFSFFLIHTFPLNSDSSLPHSLSLLLPLSSLSFLFSLFFSIYPLPAIYFSDSFTTLPHIKHNR